MTTIDAKLMRTTNIPRATWEEWEWVRLQTKKTLKRLGHDIRLVPEPGANPRNVYKEEN
jgi:hypothetical protein